MAKRLIRLTENDLNSIIKESVNRIVEGFSNGAEPEIGPGGMVQWASGQALRQARKLTYEFVKLTKLVHKAIAETPGTESYYNEILKDLNVGYKALNKLASYDDSPGNEGSGFSSDGIRYF